MKKLMIVILFAMVALSAMLLNISCSNNPSLNFQSPALTIVANNPTNTFTFTNTFTPANTGTPTRTFTVTSTSTPTDTPTSSPTDTATQTATNTP